MNRVNLAGIGLIKAFESLRLEAYKCPGGIWTIGYGHTGGIQAGMAINEETAEMLLDDDIAEAARHVDYLVDVPLNDNQYSALVAFVFNLGVHAFADSTMLRKLNSGSYRGAAEEFLKWDHAGGKTLPGLTRRRKAERELFLREGV